MTKRLLDITVASLALVVFAPALLLIAILIKVTSSGPVLYRGERIGLRGRKFLILKFRTMVTNADKLGGSSTAEDDPRITGIGKFLRKYKLDELPQLINVLVGDMSIVGPRPQVGWAVDLYTPEQRRLLDVRPGITDHASIRFRNEGEILRGAADPDKAYLELIAPEKIRLGLQYVEEQSLWVDLQIILRTILVTVRPGRGTP